MIDFKKNFDKILPYSIKQYRDFYDDEIIPLVKWYGVSFQLPGVYEGKDIGLIKFLTTYTSWFDNVISSLDNGGNWIVKLHYKKMPWFPNEEDTLSSLRTLFRERNIPNSFKGAIVFTKDDLLKYTKELISYPYAVFGEKGALYTDLEISHDKLPFIIKTSAHLNIDFLSTDKELLKKIAEAHTLDIFIVRQYSGTSLWE